MPNNSGHVDTGGKRIWKRFKKHRIGLVSLGVIIVLFASSVLSEFIAPNSPFTQHRQLAYSPPQPIRVVTQEGRLSRPFTYGVSRALDRETLQYVYQIDETQRYEIRFFVRGESYRILGLLPSNIRLLGVEEGGHLFLFGTDRFGRDLFARILWGGLISLSIPVIAVIITVILGSIIGAISGYFGGLLDNVIQRITEVLSSFPRLPLWMALAVVIPAGVSGVTLYALMAVLLSAIGWGQLARQVRGQVLSLRELEFVQGARAIGGSDWRIISKHIIPNCYSNILVMATIYIPEYLLVESALSFLGIGLTPPLTSWGVLLSEAQTVRAVVQYPWLLIPGAFICMAMLSFNFVGDALRDAYHSRRS